MNLKRYAKAIVPLLVAVVIAVLGQAGVTSDTSVKDAATLLITAGLVYFVPNKK